jgi:putative nucleotidyltransferase with HDIG domain
MRWWTLPWFRIGRKPSPKEGRGTGRNVGKSPGAGAPRRVWRVYPALITATVLGVLHFVLFPPLPGTPSTFPQAGEIAAEEIRAPFTFQARLLEQEVDNARMEKALLEPPVLRLLSGQPQQRSEDRFGVWLAAVRGELAKPEEPLSEKIRYLSLQFPALSQDDLGRILKAEDAEKMLRIMEETLAEICEGGVADMLPRGDYSQVRILTDDAELLRGLSQVTPQARLGERLTVYLRTKGMAAEDAAWAALMLRHFITPDLVFDPEETEIRQDEARRAVAETRQFIRNERIVDEGEQVTEQKALFLKDLQELLVARGGTAGRTERLLRAIARIIMIGGLLAIFAWVAVLHFPSILRKLRLLSAFSTILAVFLAAAAFVISSPGLGTYAVPVPLLALLATVLFKDRVGYATTILAVLLLALVRDVDATSVIVWIITGAVTVLAVRQIRKRSQFYQTIAMLTILAVALIAVIRLASGVSLSGEGQEYLVGVFTPIVSVALALFLLPVIEPIVGVSSDLTLLELSDLNHPLLKRMALEAQGTYHHSQVVSQLAEQAARAIDANPLLTRVGALFHDIGKLIKPDYYVENQQSGFNKHDELSPSMSALVVASHVKDGMELGRKWRLPQAVVDFIPEHHGTMVMEFFYHKALEDQANETVKVDDFRYPGPKPQSRETAILMLADAVEAATRSLTKPTPGRIKERVKQILDQRLLSGELDECNLTLRDLARVREAFIPLLTGIHHARIAYPGQKEREARSDRNGERKVSG